MNNQNELNSDVIKYKWLPNKVYFVESMQDNSVLIAINAFLKKINGEKYISWFDTSHERIFKISEINQDGNNIVIKRIESDGGGTYILYPLNLKIYNDRVKDRFSIHQSFDNEEDLISAFLNTIDDD